MMTAAEWARPLAAPIPLPASLASGPARALAHVPMMTGPSDTLIVSDLHLGLPDSRPADLLDFLRERPFGRLILLGDMLHDASFRHLDRESWRLLRHIRELGQEGRHEVVCLMGNHDRPIARAIEKLLGIESREHYVWEQEGRRCVAMHGDCFDSFISRHVRFGQLCSDLFAACQRWLEPHHGWLARLDAWQVKVARLGERVADAASRHAAQAAFDLVVCGHTHEPVVRQFEHAGRRVTYANSGAWHRRPASYVTLGPGGLGIDYLP